MVRTARPADAPAVAALLAEAFGGDAEARLAVALRQHGDAVIELVATAPDGILLGHVLFSPVRVGSTAALALAPLAVASAVRRRGLGAMLVRQGLALARARPEGWCLVLGDPAYYARFGFLARATAAVTGVPWAGDPAFQALRLKADAQALAGPARYACAFGLLPPEIRATDP
jgi:predicted N-acetyltransferase YhbS